MTPAQERSLVTKIDVMWTQLQEQGRQLNALEVRIKILEDNAITQTRWKQMQPRYDPE